MDLVEPAALEFKMRDIATQLFMILKEAKGVSQQAIPQNVITMNSRVVLRDLRRDHVAEITITYPHEAANLDGRISILSSVGLALLGRQVGEVVSWKIPSGQGSFEILKVTYQPEAVGDYSL